MEIKVFIPKTKNDLTCDITFLHKLYGEWDEVEVQAFVPISFEGFEKKENFMTIKWFQKIIISIIAMMSLVNMKTAMRKKPFLTIK